LAKRNFTTDRFRLNSGTFLPRAPVGATEIGLSYVFPVLVVNHIFLEIHGGYWSIHQA